MSTADSQNPFPYLEPLTEADEARFLGRRRLLLRVRERLGQSPRFLALVGLPGSGKTSLIRAGLLPLLGREPGRTLSLRIDHPGLDPFAELAAAGAPQAAEDLGAALLSFVQARGGAERLVLVVDNAAELLLPGTTLIRQSLIEQLVALVERPPKDAPLISVIMTVRADCATALAMAAPSLSSHMESGTCLIPATLEVAEWTTILQTPLRAKGVTIEDDLMALIVRDLELLSTALREGKREVALLTPLLFALHRLWERKKGPVLRAADYVAIGGIGRAISNWADGVYGSCDPQTKILCRRALLALVDEGLGVGTLLLSRPRPLLEWQGLALPSSSSVDDGVLSGLATLESSGLLTVDRAASVVALSHPALIGEWPQLGRLFRDEQRFLSWHGELKELATQLESPRSLPGVGSSLHSVILSPARFAEGERYLAERAAEIDGPVLRLLQLQRTRTQAETAVRVTPMPRPPATGLPLFLGFLIVGLLGALILGFQMHERELDRVRDDLSRERGARAALLVQQPGQDSAALALAVQGVAPSLKRGHRPPPLAKEGLLTTYGIAKNSMPLTGHSDRVESAVFDPTGERVLTASTDQTARIWDAQSGQPLLTLVGHNGTVLSVAFTRDGRRAITASIDGTAAIYDAETGNRLHVLRGHEGPLEMVTVSPDGELMVTASQDHTARVWQIQSGKLVTILRGHTDRVPLAVFSPDSKQVLTVSFDQTARLFDAATGEQKHVLLGHKCRLNMAAFRRDGQRILTGGWDGKARLWDQEMRPIELDQGTALHAVSFSPDNRFVATAGTDGVIRLWDATTGELKNQLLGHMGAVDSLDFSPDGLHLVSGGNDRVVRIWDVRSEKPMAVLWGHSGEVYTAAFSPAGNRVVTSSYDRTARVWDVRSGQPRAVLSGHKRAVNAAAFSSDGTRIVTASNDHTARLWRWPGGEPLAVLSLHRHVVNWAAFSPDGTIVATASADRDVRLWDGTTGAPLKVLSGHRDSVLALAFSADGSKLVSGGADHTLRIWDAKTGGQLRELPGHSGHVVWLAFSPDGKLMVSTGTEGELRLYDAVTFERRPGLPSYNERVNTAQFYSSPSGLRMVTASDDRTVRIWEPNSGAQLSLLEGFTDNVLSAMLSPNQERLLIVSKDQGLRLWDLAAEVPLTVQPSFSEEISFAAYAPPDGRYFVVASVDGTVRVFRDDYIVSVDGALRDSCELLRYRKEFESVRGLCPQAPPPRSLTRR